MANDNREIEYSLDSETKRRQEKCPHKFITHTMLNGKVIDICIRCMVERN